MHVQVLGAGCANCHRLETNTQEALTALGIDTPVEMVTDFGVIASMGVMTTPALVVDERILLSGKVADVPELVSLIGRQRTSRGF